MDELRSTGNANHGTGRLVPGTLWEKARAASNRALADGALKPIPAVAETVCDGGIPFTVWRLVRPSTQLPADRAQIEKPTWSDSDANPFLPYDPEMFVSDLTDTHVCLLNKYNVLDTHLLLVTRAFEHQSTWLTLDDFEAMRTCLAEFDGLAFYNAGRTAGASQRHKHLQYVPLPLSPGAARIPISCAFADLRWQDGIGRVDALPFVHTVASLGATEDLAADKKSTTAKDLLEHYQRLLSASGIPVTATERQSRPYNLLATRRWMMIVPRSAESYLSISVNALGFAGSLLVRDLAQLAEVCQPGPLTFLSHVGVQP